MNKFWNKLSELTADEQAAYNEADELLRSDPYPGNHRLGVVSHLKGAKLHCNHEYRQLPNSQRIIYKVLSKSDLEKSAKQKKEVLAWPDAEKLGEVHIYYTGPHPAGKEYQRIGERMSKPL